MIEKKYEDIRGYSEKDTPVQFDQWESVSLYGGKNRYIYDFSHPYYANDNMNPYSFGLTVSQINLEGYPADWAEVMSTQAPFDKPLSVDEAGNIGNFPSLSEWPNKVSTVNGTDTYTQTCPYFDENSIIFIGGVDENKSAYVPGGFQRPDTIDFFRSGYVEFSIKTEKLNQVIASGSNELDVNEMPFGPFGDFAQNIDSGVSFLQALETDVAIPNGMRAFDKTYAKLTSNAKAFLNLIIGTKNGKIFVEFSDKYNPDMNFVFEGNEFVSDNEWHHIIVNFGRPGTRKSQSKKFNKKYIEFWVDGQLDKRFDDKVNDNQIFYPTVDFLLNSPVTLFENYISNFKTYTSTDNLESNDYVGYAEFLNVTTVEARGNDVYFVRALFDERNVPTAFKGAIHTFSHGINFPVSKFEVQNRYRLWKEQTQIDAKAITATIDLVNPSVVTNSKKALKLFWNDLQSKGKFGVELDKAFQTEAYSVTHMTSNSKTETYNIDTAAKKAVNIFENVKVCVTDNINIEGPGRIAEKNTRLGSLYKSEQGHPLNMSNNDYQDSSSNFDDIGSFYQDLQFQDFPISGIILAVGDRILLTNQIDQRDNGIWIYNGSGEYLKRATDSFSAIDNGVNAVYVEDGDYANTYWSLDNDSIKVTKPQTWSLSIAEEIEMIQYGPSLTNTWKNYRGEERFINVLEDVDLEKYDLICFMNYPETSDEIFASMPNISESEVVDLYNDFVNNLAAAASSGANIFVSSPKLAEDLGIIEAHTRVDQFFEESGDAQSAIMNPFQFNEPAERYFHTHRNDKHHLATSVPGLTDKQTWTMTDFISYIPEDQYDEEQWHIKYSYRPIGLQEGDEFYIPGVAMRERTDRSDLPGYRNNYRGKDYINAVEPHHVLAGTVVTKLANSYYSDGQITFNPYDDYATTIIVHNGQLLNDLPINGKIFVNLSEDNYTYSREDYNSATIQVVPVDDPNETVSSLSWQYSTSRLNRVPQRVNIQELTKVGQTSPKVGGGGPFLQGSSNSSLGIIRSESDGDNTAFQSDLYPNADEEIYEIQEIPVRSMTWLGLQWLIGE